MLTFIVIFRLINLPDTERWEVLFLILIGIQLISLYYFYCENSWAIYTILIFFSLSYYVYYKNIFIFATCFGIVISKIGEKFIQSDYKRYLLIITVISTNVIFGFSGISSNNSILESIYVYINNQIYDNFKVKLVEQFEMFCIYPKPVEEFYISMMLEFFKTKLFFK